MPNQASGLRTLIESGACTAAPGVFDGFSSKIAVATGAKVLHASGGAISRSIGHADIGLVTMSEMLNRMNEIVAASEVPVFADADTGFGNARNAARAARCYSEAGLAGLHVEDQTFPKRCGLVSGVEVISTEEMVEKIAAMRAAVGRNFVIAARTDAVSVEGLDAALDRMRKYMTAGADMAFVEGVETLQEIEQVAKVLPDVPLVFNQAGASTGGALSLKALAARNVRLAIYPGDLQRGAARAMHSVAQTMLATGSTEMVANQMLTNAQRDAYFD